jgi:mono/diheme cytochrome c family protein
VKLTNLVSLVSVSMILFSSASTSQTAGNSSHYQSTINQYCVTCHNDALSTAGLSLQGLDLEDVSQSAEILEKVLRKLKAKSMPPSGMPRPDDATYISFANYLQSALDSHAEMNPNPARASIRRLNRTEYINAVRDLLAVEISDDSILPTDDTMYGFDNIGDVLTLSPLLAEQYISAARKVRRQALSEPEMQPVFDIYTVSGYLMQEERMGDDMPFGSQGGVTVNHYFPMDGEYVVQVRLQRNSREYIRGMTEPHQFDLRLDGERIKQITIGGEIHGESAGIFSSGSSGDVKQEHYERTADQALEARFTAKAGQRKLTVTFIKERTIPDEPLYPQHTLYDYAQYKGGVPAVHTVAVGGPYNAKGISQTASREKILICSPARNDDETCARQILTNLAHRAYRRPPIDLEIEDLMGFYQQGRNSGFEQGIGLAIERMLAGPEFLFLVEKQPESVTPGAIFPISDLELATKVAFFLWSTIPDDELLALAEAGKLSDSGVLEQQINRMLKDPRSVALVDNFATQWLHLGNLNAAAPNGDLFPYIDDNLLQAFSKETKMFFDYILRNDRPLLELLDADYTFVNDRLASHYGIPDIYGSHFRKVTLLTLTSYPNRTAPTIRGKWILENILGAPPPPPPADIPALREKNEEGKVLNMRQQMEQHRANPVCASCHKAMDPLGFALENYDAIGNWRTMDAASGTPIDTSGVLPDGTEFNGLDGLRKALLEKRQEDFILTTIEKLLTYALGRGIDYHDAPVMRDIMHQSAPNEYRLSSMIKAIVESTPFKTRRATQ